jgi:hypothetical protein
MNQIVHIFRKDCRRLWSTIAVVLVFTFLHGYGDAFNFGGGGVALGLSPYLLLYILVGLSWLVLPIAVFLLVVSVIQEESLVGSDKFWITRPYDRVSLFLEKFLFIVVWAWLPMVLHDVILVRHFGFSLSSAFGLLLWKHAQFGFFLAVAAALAVLSASFARAVVLVIVAIVIAALIFFVVLQDSGGSSVGSMTATIEILALLVVAAVGALCVITFQYRFRITSVAAAIGVAAILVCALLARFWPSSLSAYFLRKDESPLLQSVQIIPDADLKDLARPRDSPSPPGQPPAAYYPFRAEGMSDNVGVDVVGSTVHFNSAGQTPVSFYLAAVARFQPGTGGSGQFADVGSPDQLVAFAAPIHSGDYNRLKDTDGTLLGNFVLQGFRSDVSRMPVPSPQKKQDFAIGSRRCGVQSFLRGPTLVLTFDCVELEPGNTAQFKVRLQQDHREIVQSGGSGQPSSAGGWPAFLSPIVRTYSNSEFELPGVGLVGELPSGLEIIVFAEQNVGTVVRTFCIERFRPAEFSLHAWELRGVLKDRQAATQSAVGNVSKAQ